MPEARLEEINATIEALTAYRDRLQKEVTSIAKKLQMPQGKIQSILKEHAELTELQKIIEHLKTKRDDQTTFKS